MKQRRHAIYRLAKYVSKDFLLKYSNSILISKVNYHIEAWGTCKKTIKTKIDNLIIGVAIKISDYNTFGKTNDYILKENKLGPKSKISESDKYTLKTYTYKIIDIYNRLDRKYTLLINTHTHTHTHTH